MKKRLNSNDIMKKMAADMDLSGKSLEKQVDTFLQRYLYHLRYTLGANPLRVTDSERYLAFSYAIRDQIITRWWDRIESYHNANVRQVYYMSLEFLIGRLITNNVINLGLEAVCKGALKTQGMDWEKLCSMEVDAGLGNGGLGRLAACFLDSMATMGLPCYGYGLRYEYGIFRQRIERGEQLEEPDSWLGDGYPWEIMRPEDRVRVQFGGHQLVLHENGREIWKWEADEYVCGVPYDIPVIGYGGKTVNTLRLWSAKAYNEIDLENFNRGEYASAVMNKMTAETLTKVLYPNDNMEQGKELRLRQQYFFVSCTLQDILRRHIFRENSLDSLPEKVFMQLNDTHPTLVIPELMRILVDENEMDWDKAWKITTACVGYTNHTILPEALETWGLPLMQRLLPRHVQIISEINFRFLGLVRSMYPGDTERIKRMSIFDEDRGKQLRMAHLAVIGASKVNGVAKIHSDILKTRLFKDFAEMDPDKFTNMTNGITQRRWLLGANPELSALITEKIGSGWICNLAELRNLEQFIDDDDFLRKLDDIKRENKKKLAKVIREALGVPVNIDSLFDVQVKRIHEYKRQLMLALYIIILYNRLIDNPDYDMVPRTFIFAGKAAPGYAIAKKIISLINHISEAVNDNAKLRGKLKVVFLPDYRVSLAERIMPAAEVSEQISLAGTEASGTGNMKLMLNGALTVGTMDGANVEIHDEVGPDNIFIFGMRAEEVEANRSTYNPKEIYESDAEIRRAIDNIRMNVFSMGNPGEYDDLVNTLLNRDFYMVLKDLRSYIDIQAKVDETYRDRKEWLRRSLINIARSGKFSSDRTISNYAEEIWNLEPFQP
ncbi:MAG: glycogen/starch/alpha-glucan phosphorylase [Victivallales bacterium]|nr:glycogen/starch/alpha-glucan phosphorylase [Victivallales bacterium]